jgi:hypothetical protein
MKERDARKHVLNVLKKLGINTSGLENFPTKMLRELCNYIKKEREKEKRLKKLLKNKY